ncbi:hypothetical protein F3J44_21085 [Pantoea sp. Tr-811]|uniref:hypothetical protein n=1 Tax=Pantoea sp. Tr-811 TaxID=2608361 RepID=UPI0014235359|nr:hypothetical protein [Pantoea sp. Tr-811]NIF28863.1 hypothetical protein [Pantoea sp. Tr-811]
MHSFSAYTLKVHDKLIAAPRGEQYHDLSSIRTHDMLDFVKAFLDTLKSEMHDDSEAKKTYQVTQVTKKGRHVYGWIEYGEYGLAGTIVNRKSKRKTYDKAHDDSDVTPLYFNFCIPEKSKTGIALLHTAGGRGVKTFFYKEFSAYFKNSVGLNFQMPPLAHEKSVKTWLENSEVKEIRLGRYALTDKSADIANKIGVERAELVLKPQRGRNFASMISLQTKQPDDDQSVVEIMSSFASDIKAVVESGGRKKVLSLRNSEPISAIEIDETNVTMNDGTPEVTSLHTYAQDLINEFIKQVSK